MKELFLLYISKDATDGAGEEHYPYEAYPTMGRAVEARMQLLENKAVELNNTREHDPAKDGIRRPGENYYRVADSSTCIIDPEDTAVIVCQIRRVPFYPTSSRRTAGRKQTTGRFQTRPELEDRVLFYYYRTDLSIGALARNCKISHRAASDIIEKKGGEYAKLMKAEQQERRT